MHLFVSDSLVKNETSCSKDGWQAGCLVPNRLEFLQKPLWIEKDPSQTQNIVITNPSIKDKKFNLLEKRVILYGEDLLIFFS